MIDNITQETDKMSHCSVRCFEINNYNSIGQRLSHGKGGEGDMADPKTQLLTGVRDSGQKFCFVLFFAGSLSIQTISFHSKSCLSVIRAA